MNYLISKDHVSFSEISKWLECNYKHRLKYIEQVDLFETTPAIEFGQVIHDSCEQFLTSKNMNVDLFSSNLEETWKKYSTLQSFKNSDLDEYKQQGIEILNEVPSFLDQLFPNGWENITAEEELRESICEGKEIKFKGFIDATFKVERQVRNKIIETVYIIDWKSTSFGWGQTKLRDPITKSQLAYYKNFWAKKHNVDPEIIKCGFVLLKRLAKPGNKCQFIDVSAGEQTTKRSLDVINNMIKLLENGKTFKNRTACLKCEYFNTSHCELK